MSTDGVKRRKVEKDATASMHSVHHISLVVTEADYSGYFLEEIFGVQKAFDAAGSTPSKSVVCMCGYREAVFEVCLSSKYYIHEETKFAVLELIKYFIDEEDSTSRKYGHGVWLPLVENWQPSSVSQSDWPEDLLPEEPLKVWLEIDDDTRVFGVFRCGGRMPCGRTGELLDCTTGHWQTEGLRHMPVRERTAVQLLLEGKIELFKEVVRRGLVPALDKWRDQDVITAIAVMETACFEDNAPFRLALEMFFVEGIDDEGTVSSAIERMSSEDTTKFIELCVRTGCHSFITQTVFGDKRRGFTFPSTESALLCAACDVIACVKESEDEVFDFYADRFPHWFLPDQPSMKKMLGELVEMGNVPIDLSSDGGADE